MRNFSSDLPTRIKVVNCVGVRRTLPGDSRYERKARAGWAYDLPRAQIGPVVEDFGNYWHSAAL